MRLFLRLIVAVVAVAAAVVVAAVAIVMSTDTRQIADFVAQRVKEATGRELTIGGDVSIGFSLTPTVQVDRVSLANASWGSRPDMIRIERLEVGLELLPLLSREVHLTELRLVAPDILIETDAQGRGNWQFQPAAPAEKTAPEGAPILPAVHRVEIENARFTYRDGRTKEAHHVTVSHLDVLPEPRSETTRVDLVGALGEEPFTVGGDVTSVYRLIRDPDHLDVNLVATAMGVSGQVAGTVNLVSKSPHVALDVDLSGADAGAAAKRALAAFHLLPSLDIPRLGALAARFTLDGPPSSLAVKNLDFRIGPADGNFVGMTGEAEDVANTPRFRVNIGGAIKKPSVFSGLAGRPLPDTRPVKFIARVSNPDGGYLLDRLSLTYGVSNAVGEVRAKLSGARPSITADLASEAVYVDDLMKFAGLDAPPAEVTPNDGRLIPDVPLALPGLDAADLRLKYKANTIKFGARRFNGLALEATIKDGRADLRLTRLGLGGGGLSGELKLDGGSSVPHLVGDFTLKNARVEQLIAYASDVGVLSGPLDADVSFDSKGADLRQFAAGLSGKAQVVVGEGGVANRYVDLLAADLAQSVVPWASKAGDGKVNCLVSRFDVKNGLATNTGFLFDTTKVAITGGGTIDLKTEKIDMHINPRPKEQSLLSLAFPIDIGGTLAAPTAAPTPEAVVKGVTGLALGLVNPLALLSLTAKEGTKGNLCVAALDRAKNGLPPEPETAETPNGPVKRVIEGVGKGLEDVQEGVGKAIKGLFGGGK